jgi:hypothetical protein
MAEASIGQTQCSPHSLDRITSVSPIRSNSMQFSKPEKYLLGDMTIWNSSCNMRPARRMLSSSHSMPTCFVLASLMIYGLEMFAVCVEQSLSNSVCELSATPQMLHII